MIRISALSTETIRLPYGQVDATGVLADPTATTPEFALPALDVDPESGDWSNGTWETSTSNLSIALGFQIVQSPYKARFDIVGATYGVGEYHLWFRLGSYVTKLGKVEIT